MQKRNTDDGCPKSDPDCLGNAGDCHDACEALLDQVKAWAVKNYERNGWDFVVETKTDDEIIAAIGRARTLKGALANVRSHFALGLVDEMRRSAINAGR